jgi:hypothetical protein
VNRDPQSIRFEEMQTEIRVSLKYNHQHFYSFPHSAQALREELQRQRTSVMTATEGGMQKAIQEASWTKEMEDKVAR